jgi:hypothetical protein
MEKDVFKFENIVKATVQWFTIFLRDYGHQLWFNPKTGFM